MYEIYVCKSFWWIDCFCPKVYLPTGNARLPIQPWMLVTTHKGGSSGEA